MERKKMETNPINMVKEKINLNDYTIEELEIRINEIQHLKSNCVRHIKKLLLEAKNKTLDQDQIEMRKSFYFDVLMNEYELLYSLFERE